MSQEHLKEFFVWATKNDENKKKAINIASAMIAALNNSSGKKVSAEELEKMTGGFIDGFSDGYFE